LALVVAFTPGAARADVAPGEQVPLSSFSITAGGLAIEAHGFSQNVNAGIFLKDKLKTRELESLTKPQTACLNRRINELREAIKKDPALLDDFHELKINRIELVLNSVDRVSGSGRIILSDGYRDYDAEKIFAGFSASTLKGLGTGATTLRLPALYAAENTFAAKYVLRTRYKTDGVCQFDTGATIQSLQAEAGKSRELRAVQESDNRDAKALVQELGQPATASRPGAGSATLAR
jgi:hypothetical protein